MSKLTVALSIFAAKAFEVAKAALEDGKEINKVVDTMENSTASLALSANPNNTVTMTPYKHIDPTVAARITALALRDLLGNVNVDLKDNILRDLVDQIHGIQLPDLDVAESEVEDAEYTEVPAAPAPAKKGKKTK